MATGPGGIVANVLLMPAFQVGNPVQAVVLMKAHDFTRGSGSFCLHGFHVDPNVYFHGRALVRSRRSALRPRRFFGGV